MRNQNFKNQELPKKKSECENILNIKLDINETKNKDTTERYQERQMNSLRRRKKIVKIVNFYQGEKEKN